MFVSFREIHDVIRMYIICKIQFRLKAVVIKDKIAIPHNSFHNYRFNYYIKL